MWHHNTPQDHVREFFGQTKNRANRENLSRRSLGEDWSVPKTPRNILIDFIQTQRLCALCEIYQMETEFLMDFPKNPHEVAFSTLSIDSITSIMSGSIKAIIDTQTQ